MNASNRVNVLIQAMCRRPETIARINAEPERVFEEFELTELEKTALRSGDPRRIVDEGGAHPILAMHWLLARPEIRERMSLHEYPELLEGTGDG